MEAANQRKMHTSETGEIRRDAAEAIQLLWDEIAILKSWIYEHYGEQGYDELKDIGARLGKRLYRKESK